MLPYLARRIANYALLLFLATSLAYILASASLDPINNWNREDPTLNWDAIRANLIEYNISSEIPCGTGTSPGSTRSSPPGTGE